MANIALTGQLITMEFLRLLAAEMEGSWAAWPAIYKTGNARKGDTVRIRNVPMYDPNSWGDPSSLESITETSTPVTLTEQVSVVWKVDQRELTLALSHFSDRYLRDKARLMAQELWRRWPAGATLVTASLYLPVGVQVAHSVNDPESGLAVRCVIFYDVVEDVWLLHFEILCGFMGAPVYQMTAFELEMVGFLKAERDRVVAQLEQWRLAA